MNSHKKHKASTVFLAALLVSASLTWFCRAENGLNPAALDSVEAADPTAAYTIPPIGRFYSAANPDAAPIPINVDNLPCWDLGATTGFGNYLMDDLPGDVAQLRNGPTARDGGPPNPGGGGTGTNVPPPYIPPFSTNGLWLQMLAVSNNLAWCQMNNATDFVYAIWSSTNLQSSWNLEEEVFSSNSLAQVPFTVPMAARDTLFLAASDFSSVTYGTNAAPEWWYEYWFGNPYLSDGTLDPQSGRTLLYDYQNGICPNPISFTLITTNEYVNTVTPLFQILMEAGTPSLMAVLVDDNNYADANGTWSSYQSNVTCNLGGAQGWHMVSVGLKGSASAPPVWNQIRFKLDFTPPQLVVTNPMPSTVVAPYIQLQGYSLEDIATISYDLSNSNGVAADQQALFTSMQFTTNTFEYTTDAFACYNIPLAVGSNTVTLHATDLAGNVTTTNLTYIYDPTANTNPPVITLGWPQDGTLVSGTNFTVRGTVNDPFATVSVQLIDDDATNIIGAVVEQNGSFWMSNVVLGDDSEYLMITATNSAGYGSATNIEVSPSDADLVIGSVALNYSQFPCATVTGSVADGKTVLVNGVEATNNGDGTWTASYVPVSLTGTVTISAAASSGHQPHDGGSGSDDGEIEQDIQSVPGLLGYQYIQNFPSSWSETYLEGGGVKSYVALQTLQWQYDAPGSYFWDDCITFSTSASADYRGNDETWTPAIYGYYKSWESTNCGDMSDLTESWQGYDQWGPLSIEHADLSYNGTAGDPEVASSQYTFNWQAQTEYQIINGPQPSLWVVSAPANTEIASDQGVISDWTLYQGQSNFYAIPTNEITVGGQPLDGNGQTYFAAAPNAQILLPVHAPGNFNYTIDADQYTAVILANGIQLDPVLTNATFCVGQPVTFGFKLLDGQGNAFRLSNLNVSYSWTFTGEYVNDVTNNPGGCPIYFTNTSLLSSNNPLSWYYNGGLQTASVTATITFLNGKSLSFTTSAKFEVDRPTVDMDQIQRPRYFTVTNRFFGGAIVKLGEPQGSGTYGQMAYNVIYETSTPGWAEITQTCQLSYNPDPGGFSFTNWRCDGSTNYEGPTRVTNTIPNSISFNDGPQNATGSSTPVEVKGNFKDYILYAPTNPGSIFVTLGIVTWNIDGEAVYQTNLSTWMLTITNTPDPIGPDASDDFPKFDQFR